MKIVQFDLTKYLQRNIFPSRTVLVFPPFNGFRRFLIHKLIEDNFTSKDLAAFSIGQDISRRIVVCYKGLIRTDQNKKFESISKQSLPYKMIDKQEKQVSKQKSSPTVAVYRPPAARMAESRKRTEISKTDPRQPRVRRPDQQVYVPRPRRSLNNSEESSQSQSSSRASVEFDSCENIMATKYERSNRLESDKSSDNVNQSLPPQKKNPTENLLTSNKEVGRNSVENSSMRTKGEIAIACGTSSLRPFKDLKGISESYCYSQQNEPLIKESSLSVLSSTDVLESGNQLLKRASSDHLIPLRNDSNNSDSVVKAPEMCAVGVQPEDNNCQEQETKKIVPSFKDCNSDVMDTISISSESRCAESTSSGGSRSSDNSSETEVEEDKTSLYEPNLALKKSHLTIETCISRKEQAKSNNVVTSCDSAVLVISDSSSDSVQSKDNNPKEVVRKKGKSAKETATKKPKLNNPVNPEDCDWESLYDDSGECLVPSLMEELTNSLGRVKVAAVDSDYRSFQSVEERTNDGECVIEIYDFPAEFKTTDLFNVFAAYRSRNFQIKWVDDTHALGVFPSPVIADEVLACTLPFVKTRPLRLGTPESKSKARNLVLPVLPPMERPKTCPALARRLVSGALGLRLPTSQLDREKEKQVLKEAREKRRLEAKQKEAAWDGTLTSIL